MIDVERIFNDLVKRGIISSFNLETNLPTIDGDNETRLNERLTIKFNENDEVKLVTWCSGCMENTGFDVEI